MCANTIAGAQTLAVAVFGWIGIGFAGTSLGVVVYGYYQTAGRRQAPSRSS